VAAQGGIIRPSTDLNSRPQWPEAFWLLTHKPGTLYPEAPSDFPLTTRVAALATAVRVVLEEVLARRSLKCRAGFGFTLASGFGVEHGGT
jgi:hypothetical protein